MKAVAVVAVFAAGVVGGGVVAAHEAFKPAEHVQVRYVSPAADATEKAPAPVVRASPTAVPRVKVVKPKPVKRVKVAVRSTDATAHSASVSKSEATVSDEPQQDDPAAAPAPIKPPPGTLDPNVTTPETP